MSSSNLPVVAVVGATGAVGVEFMALLEQRKFPMKELRLLASARVHLHAGKGREAPFTVGSIQLDDGPIVRTLLSEDGPSPSPGARVSTTLAPAVTVEGEPRLDLRFTAEA